MPRAPVIEDSDESSPEPVVKKTQAGKSTKTTEAPSKKTKPTKPQSSEEDSEPEQVVTKKRKLTGDKIAVTKAPVKPTKATKKQSDSESESNVVIASPKVAAKSQPKKAPAKKADTSSESEEQKPVKNAKGKSPVQPAKGKPAKVVKKQSSESESEQEQPKPKVTKKTSPKASPKIAAQKKPVGKAKKQSSDEDSDLSEDEEPKKKVPAKKVTPKSSPKVAPVVAKGKNQPKKSLDLDEQSEQQEAPKKTRKASKDSVQKGKGKKVEEERGEFEVYVNNLSWTAGEKELEDLFGPYGQIVEVRLLRKEDGKSRGIGFVKFALESSRNKALELNETQQFGRSIGVQESKGKQNDGNKPNTRQANGKFAPTLDYNKPIPENIESTTIFVGNLSYNTTPESLREYFESVGTVVDSRIATEKQTGRKRGFGYVEFDSIDAVKKAFGLRGTDLDGRNINIDVATPKTNSGGAGGNRGGFGGGNRGGFGGGYGGNNNRSTTVNLSRDDQAAKKGTISEFKGKRIAL